jgi:hypothetical protein
MSRIISVFEQFQILLKTTAAKILPGSFIDIISAFRKPPPTPILTNFSINEKTGSHIVKRQVSTAEYPSYKQLYDHDFDYFNRLGDRILLMNNDLLGKLSGKLKRTPGGEVVDTDDIKFDIDTIEAINKIIEEPEQSFSKKVVKENLPILIAIYDKYKDNDQQIAENVEILRKILENTIKQKTVYDKTLDTTQAAFLIYKTTKSGRAVYDCYVSSRETRKKYVIPKVRTLFIRILYNERLYLTYGLTREEIDQGKRNQLSKSYICIGTADGTADRSQGLTSFHQDNFPTYPIPENLQRVFKKTIIDLFNVPRGIPPIPFCGFLDFQTITDDDIPVTSGRTEDETMYRLAPSAKDEWAPFFAYLNSIITHATPDFIDIDELIRIYGGKEVIPPSVLEFAVRFNESLRKLHAIKRQFRRVLLSFAPSNEKNIEIMKTMTRAFEAGAAVNIEINDRNIEFTNKIANPEEPQHWIEEKRFNDISSSKGQWIETTDGPALFNNIDDDGADGQTFRENIENYVYTRVRFVEGESSDLAELQRLVEDMWRQNKVETVSSIIVPRDPTSEPDAGGKRKSKRNKSKRQRNTKKKHKLRKRRSSQRKQNKKKTSRKIK